MKKLTFEFVIDDDGDMTFMTLHDNLTDVQIYTCALIASRDRGQELAKSLKQNGKSEFEVDNLFDRARDYAREYVAA